MTGLLSSTPRTVGLVLAIGVLALAGCSSGAAEAPEPTTAVVEESLAPEATTEPAPAAEVPPLTPEQQGWMDHQFEVDNPELAEASREYICEPDGTVQADWQDFTYQTVTAEQAQVYLAAWCAGYDGPG